MFDEKDEKTIIAILKAVAHIGVDFGYGAYEIEEEFIDMARALIEQNDL